MNAIFDENINEIIDNHFMTKDVSELVKGNFYLFHSVRINKILYNYFYKDGLVLKTTGEVLFSKTPYTKGTLQEYVDNLEGVQ